jgi:hypothetical protein
VLAATRWPHPLQTLAPGGIGFLQRAHAEFIPPRLRALWKFAGSPDELADNALLTAVGTVRVVS